MASATNRLVLRRWSLGGRCTPSACAMALHFPSSRPDTMNHHDRTFLEAIHATLTRTDTPTLEPARLNALGAVLGLSESEVYHRAVGLQRQGLIQFEWGGLVGITPKGLDSLDSRTAGGMVTVGANGSYISIGAGAVVTGVAGNNSTSTQSTAPGASATVGLRPGDLVAALAEVRPLLQEMAEQGGEHVVELSQEIGRVEAEVQEPGSTGTSLERRLQRVQEIVERAGAIGEHGAKLTAIGRLLAPALEWAKAILQL